MPPILGLDSWSPLHDEVQGLFRQIEAWINQEADDLVGRKLAFDSQVLGDAERNLRLSVFNAASTTLQAILFTHGLHPLLMYQELCRLLGQLAIFGDTRRPTKVPGYDHDDIGPIYAEVIGQIRLLLKGGAARPFDKRYFRLDGRRLVVQLDADWTLESTRMYIGIETGELSDAECDRLMRDEWSWKLGSADEVEAIFRQALEGLGMEPLNRYPADPAHGIRLLRHHPESGLLERRRPDPHAGPALPDDRRHRSRRPDHQADGFHHRAHSQPSVRRICRQGTLTPGAWAFVLSIEEGSVR